MKVFNAIVKILTALAAVAGAIYVAATYGEQIVAWCKKVLASLPQCPCCCEQADVADEAPIPDAPAAEEAEEAVEEAEAPEAEAEDETVEEIPLVPNEPVADEHDFAE